MATDWKS